jgi:hypothetical protein
MRILITGINTHNQDTLTWCLGEAGLAGMDTPVNLGARVVSISADTIEYRELGSMLVALNKRGFEVTILQDKK